jgi:hypothetical protein
MKYLTGIDLERQDCVDNAIQNLIEELSRGAEIDWDMENIGEVRDVLQDILVNKLKLMTEQEFYPYVEYEPQDKIERQLNTSPKVIGVTDRELVAAVRDVITDIDADNFAEIAGMLLGGECEYTEDGIYTFYPDENYNGALDDLRETSNGTN